MINLTGKGVMIFKNENNGRVTYSTSVSNKKQDGTYDNTSVQVQFKNGIELENKSKIDITKGFLSFYRKQDNTIIFKLIVMEFELQGEAKKPETSTTVDDLPF